MDYMPRNSQGVLIPVYVQDMSSQVGAGLTGLTPNSAGLTCYYHRDIDPSPTIIPIANLTVGSYTASGLAAISNSIAPGDYQLGAPNVCWASSGLFTTITLYGAANMLPVKMKFLLTDAAVGYVANSGITRNSYSTVAEINVSPTFPANPSDMVSWLFQRSSQKTVTVSNPDGSGGADVLYRFDGTTTIASGVYSDNGNSFTRNRYQ
jgi:hypothetical protein